MAHRDPNAPRKCVRCGQYKAARWFSPRADRTEGPRSTCKRCDAERQQSRMADPVEREKQRERMRAYRARKKAEADPRQVQS